jgi:cytidylate kinase
MTTITISGLPGTGKTTVAKLLEQRLGLRYVYSGEIFRQLAQKHNMSLEEFGTYCESHREIDEELDRYQLGILRQGDVIVEGRLSGWLAYQNHIHAVKVLLQADIQKRKKEILKREKSEAKRYKKYYNIDIKDTSIYDVIIDTGDKTPEQIMEIILSHLGK